MANQQAKKANSQDDRRESGTPGGGQGRKDEVGSSGVYPVSEIDRAAPDARVHSGGAFGQGDRGTGGYDDAGGSGVIILDKEFEDKEKDTKNDQKG
jgi:hypothetical protein